MCVVKSVSILEGQSNTILGIPSYLYWYKTPNELFTQYYCLAVENFFTIGNTIIYMHPFIFNMCFYLFL